MSSREAGNPTNLERLAGTVYFTPTGETGAISLGDVIMYKATHEREVKDAYFHGRGGMKTLVNQQVTKADLSYEIELQEHTKEIDAMLLFGEVGTPVVQAAGTALTTTLNAVQKRRSYSLPAITVSNVVVKVATLTKKQGTQDAKGTVKPADADYVLDADLGRIYILEGGTIAAAANLDITYDCAACTRDTITPLTKPSRTGTLELSEFSANAKEPTRIVTFACTLSPTAFGENQIDGDPNKFTLKAVATSVPQVSTRQA